MPVTSLPIYGLRNRAGPGSFCRHMADLHTGSAARAPSRASDPGSQPAGIRGGPGRAARAAALAQGTRRRVQRGGVTLWVGIKPLEESKLVGPAAWPLQQGRNSGSPGLSKKGEDPVPAAPPPQPLFGSHSGKLNFGKKRAEPRHYSQTPTHFLGSSKPQAKRSNEEKKKKLHAFTEADCFFLNYLVERSG